MCSEHKETEFDPSWTPADRQIICTEDSLVVWANQIPNRPVIKVLQQRMNEIIDEPTPPIYSQSCEDVEPDYLALQGMPALSDRLAAIDARTARLEAAVDRIERGLIRHGSL